MQDWATDAANCGLVRVPFVVHATYDSTAGQGKFSNGVTRPIVAEYSTFLAHSAPRLHPSIRYLPDGPAAGDAGPRATATGDLYQFAMQVMFNLPPRTRLDNYLDSNYDVVQVGVHRGGYYCVPMLPFETPGSPSSP